MTKTVSVSAIKQGTVIDHITPGQAVNNIRMLGLTNDQHQMTVGLNLKGKRTSFKDLIKIENRTLINLNLNLNLNRALTVPAYLPGPFRAPRTTGSPLT